MATYLCLLHWTKEGVEKIKESPSRLEAAKKAFASAGGKLLSFHMLLGEYDVAVIAEAPDEAALAKLLLTLASKGSVRSQTMRAFTEDEYRKIISGLS
jgi:uncharacterized protein with GYD domain